MIKPNFRLLTERERRTESRGLQHFVEEVKLEWAPGKVAMEAGGREGEPAAALAAGQGCSLQQGRKAQGTATSSDAPALTRDKNSGNETGRHTRHLGGALQ